jgi:hypothetical protein
MAKQFETKYKNDILKLLKCRYTLSWWLVAQMLVFVGIPDLIGCVYGRFVALELKSDRKKAEAKKGRIVLQRHTLALIRRAGGFAEIMHPENQEEILAKLDTWLLG